MIASVISAIRNAFVPVHPEGYRFIVICAVAALILFVLSSPLAWLAVLLGCWVTYFFRDPPRVTPVAPGLVISPADGKVSSVADAVPPPELGLGDLPLQRVSVFMNVFNVHVNRAPVSGKIVRIAYKPGIFLNAELDKASEDNERNAVVIETNTGDEVGVVQIAGLVARRIVCFVGKGEAIMAGDRFGLIRFGSRLDVYLPRGARALVMVGQTAIAGETVIAELSSAETKAKPAPRAAAKAKSVTKAKTAAKAKATGKATGGRKTATKPAARSSAKSAPKAEQLGEQAPGEAADAVAPSADRTYRVT